MRLNCDVPHACSTPVYNFHFSLTNSELYMHLYAEAAASESRGLNVIHVVSNFIIIILYIMLFSPNKKYSRYLSRTGSEKV